MELLKSTKLESLHGFPSRAGGVSEGPYASLNLATSVGDVPAAVAENFRRLASADGARVALERFHTVSQVHGATVVKAPALAQVADGVPRNFAEADAVWTDQAGSAVGIRTADCLPILIEDRAHHRVAAVHAGWRGVVARIAIHTLEAMGARPGEVRIALGPAIRECCFEVDHALADRFAREIHSSVRVEQPTWEKPHVNLAAAVTWTLGQWGITADQIDVVGPCTMCDRRFFSHRRDAGVTGRHLSFITCGS